MAKPLPYLVISSCLLVLVSQFVVTSAFTGTSSSLPLAAKAEALLNVANLNLRIFLYEPHPKEKEVKAFFSHMFHRKRKDIWNTRLYSAHMLFLQRLLRSPILTKNKDEANLFMYLPRFFPNAIYLDGKTYRTALKGLEDIIGELDRTNHTKRDHIHFHTHDFTAVCEKGYKSVSEGLRKYFIRIGHAGRLDCFGLCHCGSGRRCAARCCDRCYEPKHQIIVPPVIPEEAYGFSKCQDTSNVFKYIGDEGSSEAYQFCVKAERVAFFRFLNQSGVQVSENDSYFGIQSAGYGIWTARMYDYLNRCTVPILSSDGVVLPYERFIPWRCFTAKILSTTYTQYDGEQKSPMIEVLRRAARVHIERGMNKTLNRKESALAERMHKMRHTGSSMAQWLDWFSQNPTKNPYTLTILELLCFSEVSDEFSLVSFYCDRPRYSVAKLEYLGTLDIDQEYPTCDSIYDSEVLAEAERGPSFTHLNYQNGLE